MIIKFIFNTINVKVRSISVEEIVCYCMDNDKTRDPLYHDNEKFKKFNWEDIKVSYIVLINWVSLLRYKRILIQIGQRTMYTRPRIVMYHMSDKRVGNLKPELQNTVIIRWNLPVLSIIEHKLQMTHDFDWNNTGIRWRAML